MRKKGDRKLPKDVVTKEVSDLSVRAKLKDIQIMGLVAKDIAANSDALKLYPYVALKYFKSDWQCFSDWEQHELKAFSTFLARLQKHTWEQVHATGSRKPKHGLAYTKYNIGDVKSEAIKQRLKSVRDEISEDINFFELRVNQEKLRVHGFQSHAAFFLVALDRSHEAFPM